MEKQHIITIAGAIGSGKSSTAREIARTLNYTHFSSGDIFRNIAKERGLSIEAINIQAEEREDIDREVDEKLTEIGKTENELVIDSRLAFHWIPHSFKIFLTLDTDVAAQRIFDHIQSEGRVSQEAESIEEVHKNILSRAESERKRYANLYNIDVADLSPFDLVVDTHKHTLNEVVTLVLAEYKKWLA